MSSAVSYRYVEKNLLLEKYHYMYTPYEGAGLLLAYIEQRTRFAESLRKSSLKLTAELSPRAAIGQAINQAVKKESKPNSNDTISADFVVLPTQPGPIAFVTGDILLDMWRAYLRQPEKTAELCSNWLNALLRKFEVSKRLYASYSADLKPTSDNYSDLSNYALLAALLMHVYLSSWPSIKYLNAVLKLNDLLASASLLEYGDALCQLAALASVEAELAAVRALMTAHQVAL